MKRDYWIFIIFIALCLLYVFIYPKTGNLGVPNQDHVILISIDGLRSDAVSELDEEELPNLHYLIKNGASTLNARTDFYHTTTVPNHTSMFTGLPSEGPNGHMVLENHGGGTIDAYAQREIKTIFHLVHNAGLRTAFFASKPKFQIFPNSFESELDSYRITKYQDRESFGSFLDELFKNKPNLSFLHFSLADGTGHRKSWRVSPASDYLKAVQTIDRYLGILLEKLERSEELRELTVLIVTTDHGGFRRGHNYPKNPHNYTIPFIVWGDGVEPGVDLYELNQETRADPKRGRPNYTVALQPIRNGDAANLVLSFLDLPAIKGSSINHKQSLRVATPLAPPTPEPGEKID